MHLSSALAANRSNPRTLFSHAPAAIGTERPITHRSAIESGFAVMAAPIKPLTDKAG